MNIKQRIEAALVRMGVATPETQRAINFGAMQAYRDVAKLAEDMASKAEADSKQQLAFETIAAAVRAKADILERAVGKGW